ncbi:virulence RhuM family protein, partial [Aeoliella sp. ICT_H6.2]
MAENLPTPSEGDFLFYATEDGNTRVRLMVEGQTVWMPQKAIAELFETTVANINTHIRNLLAENELEEGSVIKDYFITAADGKSYQTKHYNLDMILAIGYRVRSPRGTQFRRWATKTLREYLVKGFVLDDERLKAAETTFGQDHFDELLERIRDIRASERRFYQKITDIYATSSDYDAKAEVSQEFFATVQNKLEWAFTGMKAAELIRSRADASQDNMGLTTWKNAPNGKIRKTDVTVAKNYLRTCFKNSFFRHGQPFGHEADHGDVGYCFA